MFCQDCRRAAFRDDELECLPLSRAARLHLCLANTIPSDGEDGNKKLVSEAFFADSTLHQHSILSRYFAQQLLQTHLKIRQKLNLIKLINDFNICEGKEGAFYSPHATDLVIKWSHKAISQKPLT